MGNAIALESEPLQTAKTTNHSSNLSTHNEENAFHLLLSSTGRSGI